MSTKYEVTVSHPETKKVVTKKVFDNLQNANDYANKKKQDMSKHTIEVKPVS